MKWNAKLTQGSQLFLILLFFSKLISSKASAHSTPAYPLQLVLVLVLALVSCSGLPTCSLCILSLEQWIGSQPRIRLSAPNCLPTRQSAQPEQSFHGGEELAFILPKLTSIPHIAYLLTYLLTRSLNSPLFSGSYLTRLDHFSSETVDCFSDASSLKQLAAEQTVCWNRQRLVELSDVRLLCLLKKRP